MPKSKAMSEEAEVNESASEAADIVIPCSVEEINVHLRAFITAFVLPQARARWLEFLVDRRSDRTEHKADAALRRFSVDERYCTRIPNSKRTATYFEATFGKDPGVYFELYTPPCKLTAIEAEEKYSWEDNCAILSYEAGKKALFFLHSGGVLRCEKV